MVFPLLSLSPAFSTLLGKEAVVRGAEALVSTSASILSHTEPHMREILEQLDLENTIGQIRAILEDIKTFTSHRINKYYNGLTNNTAIVNSTNMNSEPVNLINEFKSLDFAIKSLEDILKNIDEELKLVKNEYAKHTEKWFSSWRTSNHINRMPHLTIMKNTLEKRLDSLIKVIQLTTIID